MSSRPAERPCPICGKPSQILTDPVGPFCSDRCKMIDLGKWLGGEYCISDPLRPEHFEAFEELATGADPDRVPEEQD